MLILRRQMEEKIVVEVGGRVVAVIKIFDMRGSYVSLGCDAPADVKIDRYEVWKDKQTKKRKEVANAAKT